MWANTRNLHAVDISSHVYAWLGRCFFFLFLPLFYAQRRSCVEHADEIAISWYSFKQPPKSQLKSSRVATQIGCKQQDVVPRKYHSRTWIVHAYIHSHVVSPSFTNRDSLYGRADNNSTCIFDFVLQSNLLHYFKLLVGIYC